MNTKRITRIIADSNCDVNLLCFIDNSEDKKPWVYYDLDGDNESWKGKNPRISEREFQIDDPFLTIDGKKYELVLQEIADEKP